MTFIRILPFALLFSLSAAAACGSKSTGGTGASCSSSGAGAGTSDTMCISCLQTSCSAETSKALGAGFTSGDFSGGACAGYFQCSVGCNCDQNCILACSADSACEQALMALSTCEEAHCSSACSSHGSNSSSGTTGSTGTTNIACYVAAEFACSALEEPASLANTVKMACTQSGGVASDTCPSSGLLGCCSILTSKTCFYQGSATDAATAQMQCTQGGGTWSTTP
jgi:hypothetical protein